MEAILPLQDHMRCCELTVVDDCGNAHTVAVPLVEALRYPPQLLVLRAVGARQIEDGECGVGVAEQLGLIPSSTKSE